MGFDEVEFLEPEDVDVITGCDGSEVLLHWHEGWIGRQDHDPTCELAGEEPLFDDECCGGGVSVFEPLLCSHGGTEAQREMVLRFICDGIGVQAAVDLARRV